MPFVEYDEVGVVCADCGRSFPSSETLQSHRGEVHAANDRSAPRRPANATFRCAVCRQKFTSIPALSEHNRAEHTR